MAKERKPRVVTKPRLSVNRERLAAFLDRCGVGQNYDYVLFGDGSGCRRINPCGWSCVVVPKKGPREVFYGAASRGSNIYAELSAFVQPLGWIIDQVEELRKHDTGFGSLFVRCFSDNEYVTKYMSDQQQGPQSFRLLRAACVVAKAHGIIVTWHHLHRETAVLNAYVDRVSRAARLRLEGDGDRLTRLDPDHEAGIVSVEWAMP